MAGPLTWRNVDSPDFGTALQGMKQFSDLLGGAFSNAQGVVSKIDGSRSDLVNNQLRAKLLAYTDPNALNADLASGALLEGADMNRVSGEVLTAMGNRAPALITMQDNLGDLAQEGIERTRGNTKYDALQGANPFIKKLQLLYDTAGPEAAAQYKGSKEFKTGTANLDANQFAAALSGGRALEQGAISAATSRMNYNQDNTLFGRETLAYEEQQQVPTVVRAMLEGGTEAADIDRFIRENPDKFKGVNDRVLMAARRAVFGDSSITPYGGSSGGGSGPVSAGATTMGTPDNVAALTAAAAELGTSPEDLATVMSYETGGKFDPSIRGGKNNNHIGLIQFGREEQAQFGASQDQDFKGQLPAVVKYLKARGFKPGMSILDLYSTINAGKPGEYDASDGNGTVRSHVAQMVAQHRQNAVAFLSGKADGINARAETNSQVNTAADPATPVVALFQKAWADTTPIRTVASGLTGKGGALEGEDLGRVTKLIGDIQKQSSRISPGSGQKMNAAVAGKILEQAAGQNKGFWDIRSPVFGGDGLTAKIDQGVVGEMIGLAMDRGALTAKTQGIVKTGETAAAASAAKAQVAAVQARIEQKKAAAAARGITPNIGPELIALETAGQAYLNATGKRLDVSLATTPEKVLRGDDTARTPAPRKRETVKGRVASSLSIAPKGPVSAELAKALGMGQPGDGGKWSNKVMSKYGYKRW